MSPTLKVAHVIGYIKTSARILHPRRWECTRPTSTDRIVFSHSSHPHPHPHPTSTPKLPRPRPRHFSTSSFRYHTHSPSLNMPDTDPANYRDILPATVKPSNYAISIFDLELGGAFTYQGSVNISASILSPTRSITLNSHQLKVHSAQVIVKQNKTESTVPSIDVTYDAAKQRVTFDFAEELPASDDATVAITFEGTINNDMAGFYRSKYKPVVPAAASVPRDEEFHYMFSTQFESSDARRAFPCFDEPNLKATFDVELELPSDQVALSNMPEKSVKKSKKEGFQVVSFERTPIMSTYLLAWAIGDFEYVEAFTKRQYNGKNLPVRVYTTRGLKEQGRFALEHAYQIVDYFSEIFKIDYPLPKADLLAVHEFVGSHFPV